MEVVENKNLEQQLVEAEEKVKKLRKQLFEKNIRPITELLELNSGYVTKELICILVKATQDYIKEQKAIEFSLEKAEEITEIIEPVDDNIIPKEPIKDSIEALQEGEEVSKDIDEEEKLPPLPKVIKELYFYARKSEEGNMEFYGVSNKKLLVKGKISSVPENMSLPVIELLGFTSLDQKIKNCKVKKIFIDNKHIINKWSKGEVKNYHDDFMRILIETATILRNEIEAKGGSIEYVSKANNEARKYFEEHLKQS